MQSAKTRSERSAVNEPLIYKSERFSWNSLQINERADEFFLRFCKNVLVLKSFFIGRT